MSLDYEKQASVEIEQHSEQMLYADKQLAKAGDFEAVANNLRKRSYIRLIVAVVGVLIAFTGDGILFGLGILILLSAVVDYTHTILTQRTIRRMREASEEKPEETT